MSVLVIAEHDNASLKPSTLHVLGAAERIGGERHLLVAGHGCGTVAEAAAKIPGIASVLLADDVRYAHFLAEPLAALVAELARSHLHVLAPATTFGRNFLPRVAALLDVQQISEIVDVVSADTFVRPIHAGSALATVRSLDPIKLVTVRAAVFPPVVTEGGQAEIRRIPAVGEGTGSAFVSREGSEGSRPDLGTARVVVAGGRGLGSAEAFRLIEALADRLGGAVGATRAAVDAGYVANDCQVGQSGRMVAPDLYLAVGISGAIQHLAGMMDSRVIVAINKDPEAPVFKVADYGLVADLFQVLPELTALLPSGPRSRG
ncbi:MAG: electron transfer flavoprotein subunit alpha/FixB family protein [Alphaproteobacteria bacterium]